MQFRMKHDSETQLTVIHCRSKLRKWAYDNAYTLLLMAFFFTVTWVAMIIYGVTHAT